MTSSSDFSICLAPYDTHEEKLSNTAAGALTLGGLLTSLHIHRSMVYARLSHKKNLDLSSTTSKYDITLRSVYLRDYTGGVSVISTHQKQDKELENVYEGSSIAVLDTLQRDTILAPDVYDALLDKLNAFGSFDTTSVSKDVIGRLPTILLQFQEAPRNANTQHKKQAATSEALGSQYKHDPVVAMPPTHYMQYDKTQDRYVFGITRGSDLGVNVLGTDFMSGHDVYFDIENRRIGFAETTCNYEKLVKPHSYNSEAGKIFDKVQSSKKDSSGRSAAGKFLIVMLCFLVLGIGFFHYRRVRRRRAQKAQNVIADLKLEELEFNHQEGGDKSGNIQSGLRESPQNSIDRAIAEQQVEKRRQELEAQRNKEDVVSPSNGSSASGVISIGGTKFALDERDLEEAPDHGWRRGSSSSMGKRNSESEGTGEIL